MNAIYAHNAINAINAINALLFRGGVLVVGRRKLDIEIAASEERVESAWRAGAVGAVFRRVIPPAVRAVTSQRDVPTKAK